MLLSVARTTARIDGREVPELPGVFEPATDAGPTSAAVTRLCNAIYADSKHLCQPSEALDARWERGWLSLRSSLEELDGLLMGLEARQLELTSRL